MRSVLGDNQTQEERHASLTYCRYCPHEIYLDEDGLWRNAVHNNDDIVPGTGHCAGPKSPNARHQGIPDLTDVEAVESWLQEEPPPNGTPPVR